MVLGVSLRGFRGVVFGMSCMTVRNLRMMGGLVNRTGIMVFGGLAMVLGSVVMGLCSVGMMFGNLGISGHCCFPSHLAVFLGDECI